MTNRSAIAMVLGLAACDGGAPTCEKVVTKTVESMVASQGDNSMIKSEHIPKVVAGCEASGTMQSHTEAAKCVMAAGDFETMKACDGLNEMMKAWLKHAK
jgi:hypothetical protein